MSPTRVSLDPAFLHKYPWVESAVRSDAVSMWGTRRVVVVRVRRRARFFPIVTTGTLDVGVPRG